MATATSPQYDETRWPVLVVVMPGRVLAPDQFDRHIERVASYFERNEPFGMLFDLRYAPAMTAAQRRQIAERTDLDSRMYPNLLCGIAVVLDSALQRGVVKAIAWLTRSQQETQVFATVDAATQWLLARIAERRKTLEPSRRRANGD